GSTSPSPKSASTLRDRDPAGFLIFGASGCQPKSTSSLPEKCPVVDLIGSHRPSGEMSQFGTAMAAAAADSDPATAVAAMVRSWLSISFPYPSPLRFLVPCCTCVAVYLNRVLRPGGYFIWSATPVYRQEQRDQDDWNAMVTLIKSICWRTVVKSQDVNGIGVVIYQKPVSNSCYAERKTNEPPLCSERDGSHFPWYAPLDSCLFTTAITTSDEGYNWPVPWPERLDVSVPDDSASNKEKFEADTKYWKQLIFQKYISVTSHLIGQAFAIYLATYFQQRFDWSSHDWCRSFSTYPRTYDLLHMSNLIGNLTN
ncbi:hypothetical protein ACJX0J_042328, partial [Zea mays]